MYEMFSKIHFLSYVCNKSMKLSKNITTSL
jgi:hypothetical protein